MYTVRFNICGNLPNTLRPVTVCISTENNYNVNALLSEVKNEINWMVNNLNSPDNALTKYVITQVYNRSNICITELRIEPLTTGLDIDYTIKVK